jgi:regulator of nonsense transcripts 2
VEEWAEALRAQRAKRFEQREVNLLADAPGGGRPSDASLKKLDSNVKKNSGLVKKLRSNLFESQKASILSDIQKLNLTKYIPETVASLAAICELNKADIGTAVEAACLLHCRYVRPSTPSTTRRRVVSCIVPLGHL